MRRKTYLFATISMAIAIILGALAAHSLENHLNSNEIDSFKTGVFYQIVHALALLVLVNPFLHIKSKKIKAAFICLKTGPLIFSGSIYLLTTADLTGLHINQFLGPLTPVGGLIMILGWILLAISIYSTHFGNHE